MNFSLADIIGVILDTEGGTPFENAASKEDHDVPENIEHLLSILERMLSLSRHPSSVGFMGKHLKRELMFAILTGRFGDALLKGVMNIQNAGDIYQINRWIKQNFRGVFSVQELADKTRLSVSRFHQKFKTAVMGRTSVNTLNLMAASISLMSVNVPFTVFGPIRKSIADQSSFSSDPDPRSCSIQKQNSGMIYTP